MPSKPVIIPRQKKEKKGVNVGTIMGKDGTKGEVGIEIECEGYLLPISGDLSPWKYVEDHSLRPPPPLRGQPGMTAEYVLKSPLEFDKVPEALKGLWTKFKTSKTKLVDSNRTSVHVHLNCQSWFLNRLTSFCALYFIVEEVLTEWCGDHRVGNLFCLRAKDAESIVTYLSQFIVADGQSPIQEFLHYSGLNANALQKYGSLEIRTLRGVSDPDVILDWVEILHRLYDLSAEYPDPREVCASVSSLGPLAFFDNILGMKARCVRDGARMTDKEIAASVYEGVRIAQDLCYCRDWDVYSPMKLKPDVFGRPLGKIAKKLMNSPPHIPGADDDLLNQMSAQGMTYSEAMEQATLSLEMEDVPTEPDYWIEPDYDEED